MPAPNTEVIVAQVDALGNRIGTITLILNEQIRSGTGNTAAIMVNALRIRVTSLNGTVTTDIIVSQANSDIVCTAVTQVPPTAATAMITGRVTVNTGFTRGTGTLFVTILNTRTLATQVVFTDRLGYYQFNDLPTGDTYVITVRGKGYTFTPQTINLVEDSPLDLFGSAVGRSGSKGSKRDF
jgi:hypothetical protein